jgi:hypothetical protein
MSKKPKKKTDYGIGAHGDNISMHTGCRILSSGKILHRERITEVIYQEVGKRFSE